MISQFSCVAIFIFKQTLSSQWREAQTSPADRRRPRPGHMIWPGNATEGFGGAYDKGPCVKLFRELANCPVGAKIAAKKPKMAPKTGPISKH